MVFAVPEEDDPESPADVDSVSSSTSEGSGYLPNPAAVDNADKEMRNKIINKEEKNVRNARFFVIAAGIACAVAVGAAVNTFASDSEQSQFEAEVRNFERRQSRNRSCSLASRKRHH
jgi:hypothetical protein